MVTKQPSTCSKEALLLKEATDHTDYQARNQVPPNC
jgi:hypothetical protein